MNVRVRSREASRRAPRSGDAVLGLDDPRAVAHSVAGSKAATLARALAYGHPVLPGFVLTVDGARDFADGALNSSAKAEVALRWAELSGRGERAVVVRSSSPLEDGTDSSMAGRFTSMTDVRGWDAFRAAVLEVVGSAEVVDLVAGRTVRAPMAVLVQPHLDPRWGGVLFGADPLSGQARRLLLEAVEGGPEALVQGRVTAAHHVLSPRGRLVRSKGVPPGAERLGLVHRRELARLARRLGRLFGGPQDIEWAVDDHGRSWLLQSRPITAAAAAPHGPVLGPGPVAETFPRPLRPLECELWLEPLRVGLVHALSVVGSTSRRRLASSPVVTTVGGWAVADLELLGSVPGRHSSLLAKLDPRPALRRLLSSWRVGRLRAALPRLVRDLLARADADLARVPHFDELDDASLVGLLRRARDALTSLHGYEVLAALLVDGEGSTAVQAGLQALARARAEGASDADIVFDQPAVLALTAPGVGPPPGLPDGDVTGGTGSDLESLPPREALRLRIRWVHELTGRAAWVLGRRLASRGALVNAEQITRLRLDDLDSVAAGRAPLVPPAQPPSAPPPAAFRLDPTGNPVALPGPTSRAGQGAGGGRGAGPVHSGPGRPAPGSVLVVRTLDPDLAPLLPGLAGLVAETGAVLSHLAILARELRVPTVVGFAGARSTFPDGTTVVVDGATGEVRPL